MKRVQIIPEGSREPQRHRTAGLVLVADEDEMIVRLICHRLERDGMLTHALTEGERITQSIDENRPDLVVISSTLPGRSGFELLRLLHDRELRTPVVLLTWPGNDRDTAKAFDLGAADVVERPFSPVALSARIRRYLPVRRMVDRRPS